MPTLLETVLSGVRREVSRAMRRNPIAWRWLYNARSSASFLRHPGRLSGEAAAVLARLDRDGIAVTTAGALLSDPTIYDELRRASANLEPPLVPAREKDYNTMLLGEDSIAVEPESVFTRFALQSPIIEIANSYYRMWARLRYYNVWRTEVSADPPKQSQLWHRDHEDRMILKCFVYLSDVDEAAGPVTYARGTHPKGSAPKVEAFREHGVLRSTDDQMARSVPRDRWLSAVGPAGTIIFADTRGYHKGGFVRAGSRLMYNCMWTSQASSSQELFDLRGVAPSSDPVRAHALSPRPRHRVDWW